MRTWIYRLAKVGPWRWLFPLLLLPVLFISAEALARGGGGEHYDSGKRETSPSNRGGDSDGEGMAYLAYFLLRLTIQHPLVMIPLLTVGGLAWYFWEKGNNPTVATQRAFQRREADRRTLVSSRDVDGWVSLLTLKDPDFELLLLLDKVKDVFLKLQDGWFHRNLTPLRPFLSDATFQRFNVQLKLMNAQGVRDALVDIQVMDLQIIGLDQSEWFDTVHVRIKAQMRDTDVPSGASDEEALAAARRAPIEPFIEVWSFVRKPGTPTRIGQDLFQGKCPNCGAPFQGGASNACEFCSAVVNSGNYDWTLAEITQGIEHQPYYAQVDGLMQVRKADPALNLEVLEDRAALIFWKWIDAQSHGDTRTLAKLSLGTFRQQLDQEFSTFAAKGKRKVFLDCAVGAVIVRQFHQRDGHDQAHVEIRWSARMGLCGANQRPPTDLPTLPQRWVFSLLRKVGATTRVASGMSTDRCPQCNVPLTDSASPSCDYCGTLLSGGDQDWVLSEARTYEAWNAAEGQLHAEWGLRQQSVRSAEVILDVHERERLLFMMAAMAAADGVVDERERKLLRLCSERWSIPWNSVEKALATGPQPFEQLLPKQGPEAEAFLRTLVKMALVDGKVDRQERRMLETVAIHLGMPDKLPGLLRGR